MCDYSLQSFKSRPAVVGETLKVRNFGTGSRGFVSPDDCDTAVCVLPGTELAFEKPIEIYGTQGALPHQTAIFRQINKEQLHVHHDCLEFPDGKQILLTFLGQGQIATVLQLPAAPKTEAEVEEQRRVEVVG